MTAFFLKLVLALAICASPAFGQSISCPAQPPPFRDLRFEEDYTYLAARVCRREPLDRLKYISLGREGWFLSLGGEIRPYYEFYKNENWGAAVKDNNGYLLQRYMFHSDFHFGSRFRVFVQFKSGIEVGRRGGPRPTDKDVFDVHQAFADVKLWSRNKKGVTLRIGRQELRYGASRLVSTREGPNVRQSFDSSRLISDFNEWHAEVFAARPVETDRGALDDAPDHTRLFWGAYATRSVPFLPGGNVDLYYFGLDRKSARYDQGIARELRHTAGVRAWSGPQPLDYNFEFMYQWGRFGPGQLRAWSVASDTGYTFRSARWRPRIGGRAGISSGDSNPTDPDLQTFNPLFPRGAYFGDIGATGPQNHVEVHPELRLKPHDKVTATVDWLIFGRQSKHDGLYGVAGILLRSGQLSRARFVGHQPSVQLEWQVDRHMSVTLNYSRFFAGQFLKQTPPDRNTSYMNTKVTYRF